MQSSDLLLIFAVFCAVTVQPYWQAAGNMTNELPMINRWIDEGLEEGLGDLELATNLSTRSNVEWDLFWNVAVVCLTNGSSDAVIYGYAFRAHWYWHNNYGVSSKSILIWKDYNCHGKVSPVSFNPLFNDSDLQVAFTSALNNNTGIENDLWLWGQKAIDDYYVPAATGFAATGILINELITCGAIRVCSAGGLKYYTTTMPVTFSAVVFFMRPDTDGL